MRSKAPPSSRKFLHAFAPDGLNLWGYRRGIAPSQHAHRDRGHRPELAAPGLPSTPQCRCDRRNFSPNSDFSNTEKPSLAGGRRGKSVKSRKFPFCNGGISFNFQGSSWPFSAEISDHACATSKLLAAQVRGVDRAERVRCRASAHGPGIGGGDPAVLRPHHAAVCSASTSSNECVNSCSVLRVLAGECDPCG